MNHHNYNNMDTTPPDVRMMMTNLTNFEGRYSMRDYLRNDLEHELKIQHMMRLQIMRASDRHFGQDAKYQ